MTANRRIPDRWREYKPIGKPIKNEKIISFKTPLSLEYNSRDELDNGIREFERFTPEDLINIVEDKGFRLGLVIDFTNTKRYYNAREFHSRGIAYTKMNCVGQEIPDECIVQRFKDEVLTFMENAEPRSVLGVHCTHGVNRTGYLVCRYLIDCRAYHPEKAIEVFNEARGYIMERENYLEDLQRREPNRYRIAPAIDGNLNSLRNGHRQPRTDTTSYNHQIWSRQPWTDPTSYSHQTWNHPTGDDSYHYQRSSEGVRTGHPYPRQRPHRYDEFVEQSESFNDNNSYSRYGNQYSSYEYEGGHVGRPNRPSSSHRSHYTKPYYSVQGSHLQNTSRGALPVRDNGPRWQQLDPNRSGYSRYSRNAWDAPAEGLRNRPRANTRWK